MATSKTDLRGKKRNFYLDKITKFLDSEGEEILMIKTNQFCFPVVDDEGNELFIKVVVSIPNGSKDPETGAIIPFDGYAEAIGYETEKKQKEEKEAEKAKKKAEKIKRDKLERQRRKEQQANKEKYREGKGA
jgi:hypothetical protein